MVAGVYDWPPQPIRDEPRPNRNYAVLTIGWLTFLQPNNSVSFDMMDREMVKKKKRKKRNEGLWKLVNIGLKLT